MTKNNRRATTEAIYNPAPFTPFFKDFYCAASTDFSEFLAESADLFDSRPDLVEKIEADLDRHGLEKKKLREADRHFLQNRNRALAGFENLLEVPVRECFDSKGNKIPGKLEVLEEGRPRMPAVVAGVLLLARGYHGSCTNKEALDFMGESKSLEAFLARHGLPLPARSTTSELLNAISLQTREAILSAQLNRASQEELDTFDQTLIDSTAAKASSCWPTDAKTIFVLCRRIHEIGRKFEPFGLANIRPGRMETYLGDLSKKPFQINLNTKKKKKFRKFCREFIELAATLLCHAHKEFGRLEKSWKERLDSGRILPSLRQQAKARVDLFAESLHLATKSLEQMRQRIFQEKTFPSTERVLSVHDRCAAYIQKGGRQAVIGYKPQLARSANGFVVALKVDSGNTSDSSNLVPMVEKAVANTGVIPHLVSVDDGYSSREGHDRVRELGVKIVSISGSKGKKLLGANWNEEEYRLARAGRSAVESLMFCLKYGFDFGQLSRTGIAAARDEFLEKCLAYNVCRTILLRKRKRQQHRQLA